MQADKPIATRTRASSGGLAGFGYALGGGGGGRAEAKGMMFRRTQAFLGNQDGFCLGWR